MCLKNTSAKGLLSLSQADTHGHPRLLKLNTRISEYLLDRLAELDNEDRSHALNNAAVDKRKMGDIESAIDLAYESIEEINSAIELGEDSSHLLISKSKTQKNISTWILDTSRSPSMKELDAALQLSMSSYNIACAVFDKTNRIDHLLVMTNSELALAFAYKHSSNYWSAFFHYNQIIENMGTALINNTITDPDFNIMLSDAYSGRGRRLSELGENIYGCNDISKSIDIRRPIASEYGGGLLRELANTLQVRAEVHIKLGNRSLANTDAREAYDLRKSIYNTEPSAAHKFNLECSKNQLLDFGLNL